MEKKNKSKSSRGGHSQQRNNQQKTNSTDQQDTNNGVDNSNTLPSYGLVGRKIAELKRNENVGYIAKYQDNGQTSKLYDRFAIGRTYDLTSVEDKEIVKEVSYLEMLPDITSAQVKGNIYTNMAMFEISRLLSTGKISKENALIIDKIIICYNSGIGALGGNNNEITEEITERYKDDPAEYAKVIMENTKRFKVSALECIDEYRENKDQNVKMALQLVINLISADIDPRIAGLEKTITAINNFKFMQLSHKLAKGEVLTVKEQSQFIDFIKSNPLLGKLLHKTDQNKDLTQDEEGDLEIFKNEIIDSFMTLNNEMAKVELKGVNNKSSYENRVGKSSEIYNNPSLPSANSSQINVIETKDNKKFSITKIPGDGNCFYKAIEHQLIIKEIKNPEENFYSWQELKQCAIDYINVNTDKAFGLQLSYVLNLASSERPDFPSKATNIQAYLSAHSEANSWADQGIIDALAMFLNLTLIIYENETSTTVNPGQEEARTLNLQFINGNHYNSLIEDTTFSVPQEIFVSPENIQQFTNDNNSVLEDHPPENYKNHEDNISQHLHHSDYNGDKRLEQPYETLSSNDIHGYTVNTASEVIPNEVGEENLEMHLSGLSMSE